MIVVLFNRSDKKIIGLLHGDVKLEDNTLISNNSCFRGIDWSIADYLAFDNEVIKNIEDRDESGMTLSESYQPGHLDNALMSQGYKLPKSRDLATEIHDIKAKIADYDDLKARVENLEKK